MPTHRLGSSIFFKIMNKTRIIKGSNLPTVNISREIISVLSRLDGDEIKEIIGGIRDYVYKDKEPNVSEEIADIMDMTLDNINHIAKGYLNGKKGGRPKKSALQEVTTTEFDIPKTEDNDKNENKADLSASKPSDDNLYHQEGESGSNGLKTAIENELVETLLSDEELIEYVANKFIKTEGEDGYNMFIKLNNTDPKSDEFRILSNKWLCKWGRYLTTEKRNSLSGKITEIVCQRYYKRYEEVA